MNEFSSFTLNPKNQEVHGGLRLQPEAARPASAKEQAEIDPREIFSTSVKMAEAALDQLLEPVIAKVSQLAEADQKQLLQRLEINSKINLLVKALRTRLQLNPQVEAVPEDSATQADMQKELKQVLYQLDQVMVSSLEKVVGPVPAESVQSLAPKITVEANKRANKTAEVTLVAASMDKWLRAIAIQ